MLDETARQRIAAVRARRKPLPGMHPQSGRFLPGNKLSRGRTPGSTDRRIRNYADALEKACSPQDLYEIVRKAVLDAKRGDHYARAFLARILGLEKIKLVLDKEAPPGTPLAAYRLDALTDKELELFDALTAKMLVPPNGDSAPTNGGTQ